jgi:hypothetical protein
MSDVVVEWVPGITSVSWRMKKNSGDRYLPISRWVYFRTPTHIRKWGAVERFLKVAKAGPFRDGWMGETGDSQTKRFLLQFPAGVWERPWELLVGELDREQWSKTSIVRGLPGGAAILPSRFDRPMSVLCVLGDDGSRTGRVPLELKRETDRLLEVYDSLPLVHRQSILRPRVCQPNASELEDALRHEADVIFLSGHGSSSPPGFFLVDGTRISPERMGQLTDALPVRPQIAAFWACDTGRRHQDQPIAPGPSFYLALTMAGVASVLAMQAPISDSGAILLAQEVFQALASGDALDIAAARARSALLSSRKMLWGDSLDWACPVVWSSGLSAAKLGWNGPRSGLAHLQTSSRRARMKREDRVFFPPTSDEISFAARCTASRLSWLKGTRFGEHRERWIRLLLSIQVVLPRYVVAVELNPDVGMLESLGAWAEELQANLEMGDAQGEEFRTTLELIRRRPQTGWKRLCSLPDIFISVWHPVRYRSEAWFWDPLVGGEAPVVVVEEEVNAQAVHDGWSAEELDMQMNDNILDAAHAEAPLLANALALLATPVPLTSLEALDIRIDPSLNLYKLLISTATAEVVLSASAARSFLGRMDQYAETLAHRACMRIYAHASFIGRLTPAIREQRLHHCLCAGEKIAAKEEVCALLVRYRELGRPQAVRSLMQKIQGLWHDLPENMLIIAAWASTALSDVATASFWLERSQAMDPLERAWQHGLQAEICKAQGEKQLALDEIDSAIRVLNEVPNAEMTALISRRLRAYRQDRARIFQYLFDEPEVAAKEYEQLLEEWRGDDDAVIDIAVVLRNYAECVRTRQTPGDPGWLRGKDMLGQAAQLLSNKTDHRVFAEIEYEKARIAIAENDGAAAGILGKARLDAGISGHLMLAAICAARYFWEFETFNLSKWANLELNLSAFPQHGWAVRTLIDGRLRAAKLSADRDLIRRNVAANLEDLERNPSFDAGSDRFRIAASFAGYILNSSQADGVQIWDRFLSKPWSGGWLQTNKFDTPEEIWRRIP